jgi:hypothetical protein
VASGRGGRSVKMVIPEATAAKSKVAPLHLQVCHLQIRVGRRPVKQLHSFTQLDVSRMWAPPLPMGHGRRN